MPCPECGKLFAEAKDLIVHTQIHTELWLFQCEHCGKRLRDKQSLASHIAEDHAKLAPEAVMPPAVVRLCERKANPKRAIDKQSVGSSASKEPPFKGLKLRSFQIISP